MTTSRAVGRLLVVGASLVLFGVAAMRVVGIQAEAVATTGDTLSAGHTLVARTANDRVASRSGEFYLMVRSGGIELRQASRLYRSAQVDDTYVWHREDPNGVTGGYDRSTLTMQRDGNLALRNAAGRLLWASGTAGTGTGNRLVVCNNGDLIVFTAAGREVWSSATTPVDLVSGRTMASGQVYVNRWMDQPRYPAPISALTMQRDGDLVFRCGGRIQWSSGTHVAGSYLYMQPNGNLVIWSPGATRHPIWSTSTYRAGPLTWFDTRQLQILNSMYAVKWSRTGATLPCG